MSAKKTQSQRIAELENKVMLLEAQFAALPKDWGNKFSTADVAHYCQYCNGYVTFCPGHNVTFTPVTMS